MAALFVGTAKSADLPPEMQVDRLLVQAEREIRQNNPSAAVVTLERVLETAEEHGLEIPSAFWYRQASAFRNAGLPERAVEALTRYLQEAGRDGQHYQAALELLDEADQVLTLNAAAAPFVEALNNQQTSCDMVVSGTTSRDPDLPLTIATHVFASLDSTSCQLSIAKYSSTLNRPDGRVRLESSSQAEMTVGKGHAVSLFFWPGEEDAEPGSCDALPEGRAVFATVMVSGGYGYLVREEFQRNVVRDRIEYADGDVKTWTDYYVRFRPPKLTESEMAAVHQSVRRINELCTSRLQ